MNLQESPSRSCADDDGKLEGPWPESTQKAAGVARDAVMFAMAARLDTLADKLGERDRNNTHELYGICCELKILGASVDLLHRASNKRPYCDEDWLCEPEPGLAYGTG